MTTQIFISHITEEAGIADKLKQNLRRDFLGQVKVFVSSDTVSLLAGDEWLTALNEALRDSAIFVVLCSQRSIGRPWVNFEAGAAWMRNIPLIPVCFGGLSPETLPPPLSSRQGLKLGSPQDLLRLYTRIARQLGFEIPNARYEELADELSVIARSTLEQARAPEQETDDAIRARLDEALSHPSYKWRSVERLAAAAGISVNTASAILQKDERVRLSRGKSGERIAGLRSRVG